MDFCIRKLGIDHLLFSADYPYIPQDGARPFLRERTAVRGGQGEVRLWQCGKVVTFVTA